MMIENREALKKEQEAAQKQIDSFECRILICAGTGCVATGSQKIYEKMQELCKDMPGVSVEFEGHVPHIGVVKTGCQGICELGPLMRIEPLHYQYVKVRMDDCEEIFKRTVLNKEPVERLFYKKGEDSFPTPDDIPFIAKQTRITLENCGRFDAESLDEYIASGGYNALSKTLLDMSPRDVIDEVDKSDMRGRGRGG